MDGFTDYFIDPTTDTITYHRGLANFFTNDYRHPILRVTTVRYVLERTERTANHLAVSVNVAETSVTMKAVRATEHLRPLAVLRCCF